LLERIRVKGRDRLVIENGHKIFGLKKICALLFCKPGKGPLIHSRGVRKILWEALLLIAIIVTGCAEPGADRPEEYLIRVADRLVSVEDFDKAFENVKSAYPLSDMQNPATLNKARLRLLNQMTEEMLILKRAEDLHIDISKSDLNKALADIKREYPDGVFDQLLLEKAVSYRFWKERLKIRLIMEKVVARELGGRITITAKDISNYYKKHYPKERFESGARDKANNLNETIIKQLRREKTEKAYSSWLNELQKKYPIEINETGWSAITDYSPVLKH